MAKKIDLAPFAVVIGIAIVLQLALIGIDCRQTPDKIGRSFVEDYYYIDRGMQKYVCSALAEEGAVDQFLYLKKQEAAQRGLSTNYLRQKFTELHLRPVSSDAKTIIYHVEGKTRTCINPAFMVIGELFRIGKDHPVDTTIELVKENGQWRVCGNPFDSWNKI
jgi:hypothetical protein